MHHFINGLQRREIFRFMGLIMVMVLKEGIAVAYHVCI